MEFVTNTLVSIDAMPLANFQDSNDLKTLFINGSAFPGGNTLAIARTKLTKFDTVNLADVDMPLYVGQGTSERVSNLFETMKNYDRIVIGSPVYFSGLTGLTKTLIGKLHNLEAF
ncbi:NAD(P)H-dependent oxidoreductase [Weissella paramesenteroides]|uniref:NAD(P)H-dependent oxidoreductase n=1 Tax=Weissella paramesenteroides TaxID=1249 RepID=UPI00385773C7